MDADDRARLRALVDDYVNAADLHDLLDHIDQLEAHLTEARATKNMHKDRYEDLLANVERVRDLHEHRAPEPPYVDYCEHCGADWPCQTVRVLDGDE